MRNQIIPKTDATDKIWGIGFITMDMVQGHAVFPAQDKKAPAIGRLRPAVFVSRARQSADIHIRIRFDHHGHIKNWLCPYALDGGAADMLHFQNAVVPQIPQPRFRFPEFSLPCAVMGQEPHHIALYALHKNRFLSFTAQNAIERKSIPNRRGAEAQPVGDGFL